MALALVVAGQFAFTRSGIRARPSRSSIWSSRGRRQTASARRCCRSTIAPRWSARHACQSQAGKQNERAHLTAQPRDDRCRSGADSVWAKARTAQRGTELSVLRPSARRRGLRSLQRQQSGNARFGKATPASRHRSCCSRRADRGCGVAGGDGERRRHFFCRASSVGGHGR